MTDETLPIKGATGNARTLIAALVRQGTIPHGFADVTVIHEAGCHGLGPLHNPGTCDCRPTVVYQDTGYSLERVDKKFLDALRKEGLTTRWPTP